jgi:hypothetical protein
MQKKKSTAIGSIQNKNVSQKTCVSTPHRSKGDKETERGGVQFLRPVNFNSYLRQWCLPMASNRFRADALTSKHHGGDGSLELLWR